MEEMTMTHLRIENQNSNVEIVNAAIIQKLYNLSTEIEQNLQEDEQLSDYVSLKGNLQTNHCRQAAYDYLTGNLPDSNIKRFANLNINVTGGLYLDFQDPEVERVLLAHNVGDGIGITQTDLQNVTSLGTWFQGNTTIQSFDELSMTGITSLSNNAFKGCTSLTSVDTSNITNIGYSCFKNCTQLTSVDLSKITTFPNNYDNGVFQGCTSLQDINTDFSNVTDLGCMTFYNCTSLGVDQDLVLYTRRATDVFYKTKYKSIVIHSTDTTHSMNFERMPELLLLDYSDTQFTQDIYAYYSNKLDLMVLPPTITARLSWRFRVDNPSLSKVILLATTPPDVESTSNWYMGGYSPQNKVACDFYVPDNALTDYQSASGWSGISTHIKGLSKLPIGVWKTGLYQQYEPYLSNSSDPAYATT